MFSMANFPYSNQSGPSMRVRYNGLFDFDTLYAALIDWGKNYGYKVHEKQYKHKIPSPKGAEQEIKIDFLKNVTDFVKYTILIHIHVWDMTEVKVDVDGRKKQLTNARIEVKIDYIVDVDWQRKFKGDGWLIKKMSTWYAQIMGPNIESTYFDGLHYRVINLQSMVKKYFDMQSKAHPYEGYLGEN
jgi:hypothetical protein